MKKILLLLTLTALMQTTFTGCSHITILRTRELHAVRDTLHNQLQSQFTARIDSLENLLVAEQQRQYETTSETLRLMRAEMIVRFNSLDPKITAIESNLAESNARISRLDRQTAEVNRRIEQRLASEEEAANQRVMQIEKLFEIAMGDFNAGRFDLAIGGFEDIVRQFGDSPFAVDAAFWIAESHFAKRSDEIAERLYFEFIRDHPESDKMCAALYKLGLAYDRQDKARSRDMVWNNLIERCPGTMEVQAVESIRSSQ